MRPTSHLSLLTDGPVPLFTEENMPGVSTTVQCIVNLLAQYFVIYTALAILRSFLQFTGKGETVTKVVEKTCGTVIYAPMLCVLFLGTRMRAIQLSGGNTEEYDLPQDFVQNSMQVATWAVLAQVILVLIVPIFTGETEVPVDKEGNVDVSKLAKKLNKPVFYSLITLRYLAMLSLYIGFSVVIFGVITMKAPSDLWKDGAPAVSPAVSATINLTIQFFAIQLLLAITQTTIQAQGSNSSLATIEQSLKMAVNTVNMAPMLCILFIGARMRALQIDPKYGSPQPWAQTCFYLCCYSVLIQAILVIAMPMMSKCSVELGKTEGDFKFVGLHGPTSMFVTFVRYCALFALYGGFTAVMCSVFLIKNPNGPTPAVSPALTSVMNLCVQYFIVYLIIFVAQTAKQMLPNIEDNASRVIHVMESALKTVMFAPMLSILFVATRMRSLQLTKAADGTIPQGAGPQAWAQDCMFLATWAVLIQIILVVMLSIFYPIEMDEDGNVKAPKNAYPGIGIVVTILRYLCMVAMFGGVAVNVVAIFSMTPETLPPYGKTDHFIPHTPMPAPPTPPTAAFF